MTSKTLYICPECGEESTARRCPKDNTPTVRRDLVKSPGAGDPLLGTILDGKFFVEERIGRGGMAVVYRARHLKTDAPMALKVLSSLLVEDLTAVRRFYKEARLAATLLHPNTVRVFDFGSTEGGACYMAMEYLQGRTLGQSFSRIRPMDENRLVHIGAQALRSLGEAHEKGLVHRDLKPENIFLIDHYGVPDFVKVLDFGIAKAIRDHRESLTETGSLVGTPKYMSPEQSQGENLDGRSDLYSLGVIMYEMLCGKPPFEQETAVNLLMSHVHDTPQPIQELCPKANPDICGIIMSLLNKRPSERPESAAAVLSQLLALQLPPWTGSSEAKQQSASPTITVAVPPSRPERESQQIIRQDLDSSETDTPTRQVRGNAVTRNISINETSSTATKGEESSWNLENQGAPAGQSPQSTGSTEFLNPASIDDSVVVVIARPDPPAPGGLREFFSSKLGRILTLSVAIVVGASSAATLQTSNKAQQAAATTEKAESPAKGAAASEERGVPPASSKLNKTEQKEEKSQPDASKNN